MPGLECDICILGEPGTGKSSLVLRYVHGAFFSDVDSSVEDLYRKQVAKNGISRIVSILDSNTQADAYNSSRKQQIRHAAVLVFAYSIADRESFTRVADSYEQYLGVMQTLPPVALVGLKSDLESERQVGYGEGQQLAASMNAAIFEECSSKRDIKVDATFAPLVDLVIEKGLRNQQSAIDPVLERPAPKASSLALQNETVRHTQTQPADPDIASRCCVIC